MTTYNVPLYTTIEGFYENYFTGDTVEVDFYNVDFASITALEGDPDHMTIEDGVVTYPGFDLGNYFNYQDYYEQSAVYRFDWAGGTTFLFTLSESREFHDFDYASYSTEDMWFTVGGDPLPDFSDLPEDDQFDAFEAMLDSGELRPSKGYPDGKQIPLADLPDVVITENDVVIGTPEDDYSVAGIGNDWFLEIDGSGGADYLDGGAGIDTVVYEARGTGARSAGQLLESRSARGGKEGPLLS